MGAKFDLGEIRRFGGLTNEQTTLLAEMKPMLEKHGPTSVASLLARLKF